jgi:superfamily II DNA/RNA helicase
MLFSATLDGAVGELANAYTTNASRFEAGLPEQKQRAANIEHSFVAVTNEDKIDKLVERLEDEQTGLAVVFVRTKHGADRLAHKLTRLNIAAAAMHGNLSQNQRERALAQFSSGRVTTLVATDVAARGLDVDDVTHVINFDPPGQEEDYVHRIGRTGRAGRSGTGITLVLPEQLADVARIAKKLGHAESFEASGMKAPAPKQHQRPQGPRTGGANGGRNRRRRGNGPRPSAS